MNTPITTHMKPIIAIVAGGYSGEYEVSLRSAQGIASWLDRELFEVYTYIIDRERWYVRLSDGKELELDKATFGFVLEGQQLKPSYAYITIHGTPGEDGILQGYLDMLGIPYNTGGVLCETLTFNKYVCNRYLSTLAGVRTAPSVRLLGGESDEEIVALAESLTSYPIFVKPNTGGSSVATTRVETVAELLPAVRTAFAESSEVMMEALISGVEVTCGAYSLGQGVEILEITEVVSKNAFFDYDAKYNGAVEEITPARIPHTQAEVIRQLTQRIYDYVQARGIVRIDYIIEADGYPTLLEVNTTPGMTPTSFVPQQVEAAGLQMQELLTSLIQTTLSKP